METCLGVRPFIDLSLTKHSTSRQLGKYTFKMIFILLTIIITTLLECTNACGVSTHISIANEALQSFADTAEYNVSYRDIILNNYDAFYAGSNYPDAMYSSICFGGRYHDISEDTHWAPFLNATVNYIRKTYTKPWSKVKYRRIRAKSAPKGFLFRPSFISVDISGE
jgi:hypothetical protein